MKLERYLVIGQEKNKKPTARLTVTPPGLDSNEIAVNLTVNIPDELFYKPQLRARINVPAGAVTSPMIETEVVDNIQEIISKELGVDLKISLIDKE